MSIRNISISLAMFAALTSSALLAGCEKKTPADKAADSINRAGDKIGDAADKVGDKTKDAANKVGDKASDAADKMKEPAH